MEHPIDILIKSEAVLMKRISRMKTGKPRSEAQQRLAQIREAIKLLIYKKQRVDDLNGMNLSFYVVKPR
jgi:hypothetical protein